AVLVELVRFSFGAPAARADVDARYVARELERSARLRRRTDAFAPGLRESLARALGDGSA
ncbi:MAG TPA: hypothetical protein VHB21_09575, partial [Minicystis sp.]|nr:hypothetical protein [Minicystis sp.]